MRHIDIPYLDALQADPRPTFVLDLTATQHGHSEPHKPVFCNAALQNTRRLRDGLTLDGKERVSALSDFETCSSGTFLSLEWIAFTIKDRWRIVSATTIPCGEEETQEPASLVDTHHLPTPSEILIGSSAHVDHVRRFDWASTKIGEPIQNWPPQLVETCNLALSSPHPGVVFWGPELVIIYNEATIPILGDRHPHIMGQRAEDTYPEVWDMYLKPLLHGVMKTGISATLPDTHLCLVKREGAMEEGFFSNTCLPIIGPEGTAVGIFEFFYDVTALHLWKRRNETLLKLNAPAALAQSLTAIWDSLAEGVEANVYDIPQLLLYSVESEADSARSVAEPMNDSTCFLKTTIGFESSFRQSSFRQFSLNDNNGLAPLFRHSMESAIPSFFDRDNLNLSSGFWDSYNDRGWGDTPSKLVIMPIRPNSQSVVAFLLLSVNTRLPFDDGYREFIHFLQAQISSSVASTLLLGEEVRRGRAQVEQAASQLRLEAQMHKLRFSRFAETAPVGIATFSPGGHLLWANTHFYSMTDIPKDVKFEPEWWNEYIYPDDRGQATAYWNQLAIKTLPARFEIRIKRWSEKAEPRKQVQFRWVLVDAYHEEDENGIPNVVACYTDINDQKQAQELQTKRLSDVVEAKRQIENFIDITSHEIRNPLSAVLQCGGEIVTLCGDALNVAPTDEHVLIRQDTLKDALDAAETILFCTLHQKRIVDDILTLSKVDSGLLPMVAERAQPIQILDGVLKMFERELRASDIEMHFHIDPSFSENKLDWVKLDRSRFSQMVINLLSNALKFTKTQKDRKIDVRIGASMGNGKQQPPWLMNYLPRTPVENEGSLRPAWTEADSVNLHFSVTDTGGGMSDEECKLLFARFSQASPRTHVQYGGSGLGLYICRALVEMHKGQIGLTTTAGEGSTFAFFIEVGRCSPPRVAKVAGRHDQPPMATPALSAPLVKAVMAPSDKNNPLTARNDVVISPASNTPARGKHSILLVEDNVINARVVSRQLAKLGHTVLIAQHGQEALDVLKTTRLWKGKADGVHLSFILMDVEMPVMDGTTCASRIRKLQRDGDVISHVPIIAITGNARDEKVQMAKAAGMDEVVLKPFTTANLVEIAEELLRRH